MTLDQQIITDIERRLGYVLADDLKIYLLSTYANEPFPNIYSEQDLYINIHKDIRSYNTGKLNVTIKNSSELRRENEKHLQNLYIEKVNEIDNFKEYIKELEDQLYKNKIALPRQDEKTVTF